jgi:alkylhydroperoxidase family enzyme
MEELAMLDGTRILPVNIETLPDDLREVLDEHRRLYGAPLYPYLFYARNPAYFRAAHAMWTTLREETPHVPGALRGLLNRRVASWNKCEF